MPAPIPLGSKPATLRRATGPNTIVDGISVAAPTADTTIYVSWQPLGSHEMQTLPEGDRQRDPHKGYSNTLDIRTVSQYDGTPPDRLVKNGIVYQIRGINEEESVLPNTRLLFLRIQEAPAPNVVGM